VTPNKRSLTGRPLAFLLALAYGFFGNPVWAREVFAKTPNQNPPGILIATTESGVRYLAGGIGSSEREVMENWGANCDLKLIFAELSGHLLSDVRVVIQDRNAKEILTLRTNGPWLYVDLFPGTYRVKAVFDGMTKEIAKLRIPEHGQVVRLIHWDLNDE
jgi:hypothetical protein